MNEADVVILDRDEGHSRTDGLKQYPLPADICYELTSVYIRNNSRWSPPRSKNLGPQPPEPVSGNGLNEYGTSPSGKESDYIESPFQCPPMAILAEECPSARISPHRKPFRRIVVHSTLAGTEECGAKMSTSVDASKVKRKPTGAQLAKKHPFYSHGRASPLYLPSIVFRGIVTYMISCIWK